MLFLRTSPTAGGASPLRVRNAVAQQESAQQPSSDDDPPTSLDTSPTSLISLSNIQRALVGEGLPTADHYAVLGVPRGTTYEEISKAFREKCEDLLQQGLDEDVIRKRLQTLKGSYEVLSSVEQRRLYDWSLIQSERRDGTYRWPYEADITQSTCAPGPPRDPEDEEAIRKVGYFFLGWFILSLILMTLLK